MMSTDAPVALHALVLERGDGVLHLIGIARADRDIGAFAASVSAIARPMPRVPPRMTAFLPLR